MARADELQAEDVLGPRNFAENGYPHEAWKTLREEAPLRYFDLGPRPGFWAVVKRADIVWLSKQPTRFVNAPRMAIFADSPPPDPTRPNRALLRHLLNMDPPDHPKYRNLASSWFTPRAIARRRPEIERIAEDLVDALASKGEADFVEEFTAPLTLSVLADMLGVPRSDWRKMFEWTNQIAGSSDPEYQIEGDDSGAQMRITLDEMFGYFTEMVEHRRVEPTDDVVSLLANAQFEGETDPRVPALELLSYFSLLVVAGNETTRNAASGGLIALIENPGEMAKLKKNPSLVNKATEEIVRWTSPVIQFCRTPVEDFEMHGQKVKAGDSLCLLYPSANRDAEFFEDPDSFRIDRSPNPHVGFGIGEHFCLGANLARLEIRIALEKLIPRLEHVELVGPMDRVQSSFLGGVKRMPIRFETR
ncbi:MAG: cytochrome P450 [Myxococcota bacterium]|jgi:cytochrome P450